MEIQSSRAQSKLANIIYNKSSNLKVPFQNGSKQDRVNDKIEQNDVNEKDRNQNCACTSSGNSTSSNGMLAVSSTSFKKSNGCISNLTPHCTRHYVNRKHVKLKTMNTTSSNQENGNRNMNGNHAKTLEVAKIDSSNKNGNHFTNSKLINHQDMLSDEKHLVLRSVKRLGFSQPTISPLNEIKGTIIDTSLLERLAAKIDVIFERQYFKCQPKKMRSSPKEIIIKEPLRSTSSDDCNEVLTNDKLCCQWFECTKKYSSVEKFIKHVKKEHIQPFSNNDVFVCLWRNCRFTNQPSCSYKWLCKHVLRHCDVKPFKCVIHGCDMAFATQNGLARHVPTHFNEGNVRRTCVKSNTEIPSHLWESPKSKKNLRLKLPTTIINKGECSKTSESQKEEGNDISRFQRFLGVKKPKSSTNISFCNTRSYKNLKRRLDDSTCNPVNNNGYIGKSLRIDHQVIGKRITSSGTSETLLAPSLDKIIPETRVWLQEKFLKDRELHVDLPIYSLKTEVKNTIFDSEYRSRRQRRKRK